MAIKDQLKAEIENLNDQSIELLYKIARQLTHISAENQSEPSGKDAVLIFQEIANMGGIGIQDPQEWQRDIRNDRGLPFRAR